MCRRRRRHRISSVCVRYRSRFKRRVRDAGNDPGKKRHLATFAFNFMFVLVSPSEIHAQHVSGVPCRPSDINYSRSARCRSHDGVGLRTRKPRHRQNAGVVFSICRKNDFAVQRPYWPVYTLRPIRTRDETVNKSR